MGSYYDRKKNSKQCSRWSICSQLSWICDEKDGKTLTQPKIFNSTCPIFTSTRLLLRPFTGFKCHIIAVVEDIPCSPSCSSFSHVFAKSCIYNLPKTIIVLSSYSDKNNNNPIKWYLRVMGRNWNLTMHIALNK